MAEITIKIVRVENPFDKPSLIVRDTDTVARLKRNIRSWKNIPVEEQLLVHYQEILDDNKTLQYYGIGDESKVQLREHLHALQYVYLVTHTHRLDARCASHPAARCHANFLSD